MARRQAKAKQNPKKIRRGRRSIAATALLLAVLLIGGFFGWMRLNGEIVHLKFAEVYLEDLPAGFDGATMLYISDFNIRSEAEGKNCARMMQKLSALQPDLLLLGGDYSAASLFSSLNGENTGKSENAAPFIASLANFPAPLGKFAVVGENDDPAQLEPMFASAGVQLLQDFCASVQKNGDEIVLAGLSDVSAGKTPYEEIGAYFSGGECVVVLAHNPSSYIGVRVAEARGGGAWADLVLSGHTLGGQIRIFDRTLRNLSDEERRCISGWHYGDDLPMLVSQGLGCMGAKLRLGTQSEVWMITLRRPGAYNLPLL